MGDILGGFFDALFNVFKAVIQAVVNVATFNPIAGLDTLDTSSISAPLGFIRRFLPLNAYGSVVISFLPVFIVIVLILILWRWIKAAGDD